MSRRKVTQASLTLALLLIALVAGFAVGSLSSGPSVGPSISTYGSHVSSLSSSGTAPKVVATFFPVYFDTLDVLGGKGSISLLVPYTKDVHEFEPTPSSIQLVAQADALVYNGAGLEPWIPQMIQSAANSRLVLIDSSAGISLINLAPVYQRAGRVVDPHVWNDPVLAQLQVKNILQGLIKADPADAQYFTQNANALNARFQFMDREMRDGTAKVATRTFVSFHEAFAYLANEYDLTQVPLAGPFEEEPSPSDIAKAVDAINRNHLCVAFAESLENPAQINAVASQTHARVWVLDPLEGLSEAQANAGMTYLVMMQQNIYVLLQALNQANC